MADHGARSTDVCTGLRATHLPASWGDGAADPSIYAARIQLYLDLRAAARRELEASGRPHASDDQVDAFLKKNLLNILGSLHARFWYEQRLKSEREASE